MNHTTRSLLRPLTTINRRKCYLRRYQSVLNKYERAGSAKELPLADPISTEPRVPDRPLPAVGIDLQALATDIADLIMVHVYPLTPEQLFRN